MQDGLGGILAGFLGGVYCGAVELCRGQSFKGFEITLSRWITVISTGFDGWTRPFSYRLFGVSLGLSCSGSVRRV
jgi:hypothetical protein